MAGATLRPRFIDLNQLALLLQVDSFSAGIVNWGFFEPRWWRNYLHSHSFFEVCYAYAGRGVFRNMGMHYTVRAGEVFVAKPGEPHEIVSSVDEPLGIYFWSYTLVPSGCPAPRAGASAIDALLCAFLTSHCWVSDHVDAMQATLDLLSGEIARKQPGYHRVVEGLVVKLLLDTARAVVENTIPAEEGRAAARNPAEAQSQQIVAYLRDNYGRAITIREVAAQVHLSERHTSRVFRRTMGTSIMDYLTALRMEVAARLLLDKRLAIQEVARAGGYPDVRYFTTLFHRHMGMTPGCYRQTNGTRLLVQGQ